MSKFEADERQRKLIEEAREAHADAQAHSQPAPDTSVEKWSSEVGIESPIVKRSQKRGLVRMIAAATKRMVLYDKELPDVPVRPKHSPNTYPAKVTAMTARDLIALLQQADPESTVLFLDDYADLSEADEVFDVLIPADPWTHECGRCHGEKYSIHYPDSFEPRDESYTDVTHEVRRVVLLTNGPTNFRRVGLAEQQER